MRNIRMARTVFHLNGVDGRAHCLTQKCQLVRNTATESNNISPSSQEADIPPPIEVVTASIAFTLRLLPPYPS